MGKNLTQQQETFCLRYFEIGNATEASILAGYAPKYAGYNTPKLLNNPKIKVRLQELRQKAEDDSVMNVLERKQRLTEIARADLTKIISEDGDIDFSNCDTGVISEIKVEDWRGGKDGRAESRTKSIKIHSKIQAIDLLNKMDNIYSDSSSINIDNRKIIFIIGKGYAGDKPDLPADKQATG